MNLAYGWGASSEPNKGCLCRILAFSAVAQKEWLLVSALGLCTGNTPCAPSFLSTSSVQSGNIQKKQSARNMNHSLALK